MNKPKAIFFDLDGTLVDTSEGIVNHLNRAFEMMNLKVLPKSIIMKNVGYGADYLATNCIATYDVEKSKDAKLIEEVLSHFTYLYHKYPIENTRLYQGVLEFLKNSDVLMGVISNKPEALVKVVLNELEIIDYFRFEWGIDTFDYHKPNPKIIETALHMFNIDKNDVWFIGDSFVDIQTAKGADVTSIALEDGFTPKSILTKECPDFQFKSFNEFSAWARKYFQT
jgi:phosphoglycolate phosphatase